MTCRIILPSRREGEGRVHGLNDNLPDGLAEFMGFLAADALAIARHAGVG